MKTGLLVEHPLQKPFSLVSCASSPFRFDGSIGGHDPSSEPDIRALGTGSCRYMTLDRSSRFSELYREWYSNLTVAQKAELTPLQQVKLDLSYRFMMHAHDPRSLIPSLAKRLLHERQGFYSSDVIDRITLLLNQVYDSLNPTEGRNFQLLIERDAWGIYPFGEEGNVESQIGYICRFPHSVLLCCQELFEMQEL